MPQLLSKALRAGLALAAARIALPRIKPVDVLSRNRSIAYLTARTSQAIGAEDIARHCDEAAFFIGRMALRVPWRSDCLVQALAGQQWLADAGIASEIVVGTALQPDGTFLSHAWLRQRERIVLGGNISGYRPLLEPERR